jgi:hypothetical protein
MRVLNVEPGTTEWANARLGIPTASCFDQILTPAKLEFSKSADRYARQLLCEQLLGAPLDDATSGFMQRGTVMEREAVGWYDLVQGVDTAPGGFSLRDDGTAGCTPDRFVGHDGLLEIKCPTAQVHLDYLLDDQGIGYKLQVQGQLWVCEREWNDTLSYHPGMPKALVRQHRDEKVITAIAGAVGRFQELMHELRVRLQQRHGLFEGADAPTLQVIRGGA